MVSVVAVSIHCEKTNERAAENGQSERPHVAVRSPASHPAKAFRASAVCIPARGHARPPRRASAARVQVLRSRRGAGLAAAPWTLSAPRSCMLQPQGHCISRAEETLPHRARPLSCSGSGFAWGQAPSGKEESRHPGSFGDSETGTCPTRIGRRPAFTTVIPMHWEACYSFG